MVDLKINSQKNFYRWTSRNSSSDRIPPRILVVDDDHASADALTAALVCEGHNVRSAYNAIDSFAQIDGWRPAIILLDMSMPEHDGFTMAKILRRLDRTRDIVVVAVTALPADYVQERCSPGSLDAYLQKGSPPCALLEFLQLLSDGYEAVA